MSLEKKTTRPKNPKTYVSLRATFRIRKNQIAIDYVEKWKIFIFYIQKILFSASEKPFSKFRAISKKS